MPTVLHLAPHPDDELLPAGGTLLRLRDAGWDVVNLACSLGRPAQHARRQEELEEACARAGFGLRIAPSARAPMEAAALAGDIAAAMDDLAPELLVGPSPHDEHPGHEAVGRATAATLAERPVRPRWWLWNLWGDATPPTLLVELDEDVVGRAAHALAAHEGELARNDYRALLELRTAMHAITGPERVLGFGSPSPHAARSEVFCELLTDTGTDWPLAAARRLDPAAALDGAAASGLDAGAWLAAPSARTLLGAPA